jgi:hypothetical protein
MQECLHNSVCNVGYEKKTRTPKRFLATQLSIDAYYTGYCDGMTKMRKIASQTFRPKKNNSTR